MSFSNSRHCLSYCAWSPAMMLLARLLSRERIRCTYAQKVTVTTLRVVPTDGNVLLKTNLWVCHADWASELFRRVHENTCRLQQDSCGAENLSHVKEEDVEGQ